MPGRLTRYTLDMWRSRCRLWSGLDLMHYISCRNGGRDTKLALSTLATEWQCCARQSSRTLSLEYWKWMMSASALRARCPNYRLSFTMTNWFSYLDLMPLKTCPPGRKPTSFYVGRNLLSAVGIGMNWQILIV
jgi:hypothetical protein